MEFENIRGELNETFSFLRVRSEINYVYDIAGMVEDNRIDPKMVFSYVQEVYRMCNDL